MASGRLFLFFFTVYVVQVSICEYVLQIKNSQCWSCSSELLPALLWGTDAWLEKVQRKPLTTDMSAVLKVNQAECGGRQEQRQGGSFLCILSVNRRHHAFRFSGPVDELTSGRSCFVGWICSLTPPPPSLPLPSSLKQDAALCLAGARWVRGRLHPAGEAAAATAAAAEPSLHNGAPGEGEGRHMQGGWKQEWWEHGRDKRQALWMERGCTCLAWTVWFWHNISKPAHNSWAVMI